MAKKVELKLNDLMDLNATVDGVGGSTQDSPTGGDTLKPMDAFGGETDLSNFDQKALDDLKNSAEAEKAKEESEKTPNQKKRAENLELVNKIISKVSATDTADTSTIVAHNRNFGKFLGFVTKTNEVIRLGKIGIKKTGADGKPILKSSATPENIKKFNEDPEAKIPKNQFELIQTLNFRQSAPPSPFAGVLETPASGRFAPSLIKTMAGSSIPINKEAGDDLIVDLMDKEELFCMINAWYGGRIPESDKILGEDAGYLCVKARVVKEKNATPDNPGKVRQRLVVDGGRKKLLVPGNYFPIKVYKEVPYQNLDKDTAAMLNNHIEALLKGDKDGSILAGFNAKDKDAVKKTTAGVTSKVFRAGASAGPDTTGDIKTFWDKSQNVKSVMLPVREKVESKGKPGTYSYKYEYYELNSENGPLSVKQYKEVFDLFGMSPDEFSEKISAASKSKKKKKSSMDIDNQTLLKALASGGGLVADSNRTFSEIQESLNLSLK